MWVYLRKILLLLICSGFCHSLFVPEQLPTLLSFIYTNIPPVRKGTDSRIGLGFRLGPNADFQVLFELGPQQNTLPIGPDGSNTNTNKRETQQASQKTPTWLQLWKQQSTGIKTTEVDDDDDDVNSGDNNNIPIVLDEDVINHLKQLYKEQPKNNDNNANYAIKNNITAES